MNWHPLLHLPFLKCASFFFFGCHTCCVTMIGKRKLLMDSNLDWHNIRNLKARNGIIRLRTCLCLRMGVSPSQKQ
jgi:hypothetical protein